MFLQCHADVFQITLLRSSCRYQSRSAQNNWKIFFLVNPQRLISAVMFLTQSHSSRRLMAAINKPCKTFSLTATALTQTTCCLLYQQLLPISSWAEKACSMLSRIATKILCKLRYETLWKCFRSYGASYENPFPSLLVLCFMALTCVTLAFKMNILLQQFLKSRCSDHNLVVFQSILLFAIINRKRF